MAIGFLKMTTISRGTGATACARMAYICRARIEDPRTGIVHDYRRGTGDVEAAGVVGWNGKPASLAAEMSKSEKRKDACEGRSVIVALPHELDADARQRVVVAWCEDLRARHSVACAYALHKPDKHGDERNFHAHIVVSARRSDGATLGEKTRELDNKKTGGAEVEAWRVAWAARCDEALAQTSSAPKVDMRSWTRRLESEGLPGDFVEPEEHLGPARAAAERRGQRTAAGERNRRRRKKRCEVLPVAGAVVRSKRQNRNRGSEKMDNSKSPAVRLDPAQLAAIAKRADAARATGGSMPHNVPHGASGREAAAATRAQQKPGLIAQVVQSSTRSRGVMSKAKNAIDRALDKAERDARYER